MSINFSGDAGFAVRSKTGGRTAGRSSGRDRIGRLLLMAVDAGLAAALFVVPLVMGGRMALGQLVLVAIALWVAVCWCLRQCFSSSPGWIRSPLDLSLPVAIVLVGLQVVPLRPSWIGSLSPRLYETLPMWAPQGDSGAGLGVWNTLSLTPAATWSSLFLLVAFAMLLVVTVQRVRSVEDVERLIRWVAIAALSMAVFGLVQCLAGNGKFFWVYEHPYTNANYVVKGSFTNPNHFAHFIALGIGPLIWWVQSARRKGDRSRREGRRNALSATSRQDVTTGLLAIALAFAAFVGLMSLSRGGAMAIFAAGAVGLAVLYRGRLIEYKTLLAAAGIAAFVGACLAIHGFESVSAELDDFRSISELDKGDNRRKIWAADAVGIRDHLLTGTGLGSHREVVPIYLKHESVAEIDYTHAENGYVQVALEAGLPGLTLALAAVALTTFWCLSSLRRGASDRTLLCIAAIAPCLAASYLHSLADFVWYVPGCMVVVVMMAACACRLWQFSRADEPRPTEASWFNRAGWVSAAVLLVVVGVFMLQDRLTAARACPAWHRYLALNFSKTGSAELESPEMLHSMLRELSTVVERQPGHARAHARLAEIHLALFERGDETGASPFTVRQVRDAATASQFASRQALCEWLGRAFGERWKHLEESRRHARQAVEQCPLLGETYIHLAEVAFLEGPSAAGKDDLIQQALAVRPQDGLVLFEAGREEMLAGRMEEAFGYWRRSYHSGSVGRRHLLPFLAAQIPAAMFIEIFEPDLRTVEHMAGQYHNLGRPDQRRVALLYCAEAYCRRAGQARGAAAADAWVDAAKAYRDLEDQTARLQCLENAVGSDATNYDARNALGTLHHELGTSLLESNRAGDAERHLAEAEKHFRWCLQWKPTDKKLLSALEAVYDRRLRIGSLPVGGTY